VRNCEGGVSQKRWATSHALREQGNSNYQRKLLILREIPVRMPANNAGDGPSAVHGRAGHYDVVTPDRTVASESAKVRWFYAYMGIPEKTRIEFFSGPHMIYGRGTFEFLREHLLWKPGRWSPVSD
jgi:hypothetical protein